MGLITFLEASKTDNAPSPPMFTKMKRTPERYPFLRETAAGWRVDADDPEWAAYLGRERGISAGGGKRPAPPPPPAKAADKKRRAASRRPPQPPPAAASRTPLADANARMVIEKAQRAEIDRKKAELQLRVLEGQFIDKPRMLYYMGYFQRAITEGLDNIRREGADSAAVRYVCEQLKSRVAKVVETLKKDEGIEL